MIMSSLAIIMAMDAVSHSVPLSTVVFLHGVILADGLIKVCIKIPFNNYWF